MHLFDKWVSSLFWSSFFLGAFILLFVLITVKSSWMVILTFFKYDSFGTCFYLMVAWYWIIASKKGFTFGQVPASLVHAEFQKLLSIILIMIFLAHITMALTFSFFPCYVCLGCICSHSSTFVTWLCALSMKLSKAALENIGSVTRVVFSSTKFT